MGKRRKESKMEGEKKRDTELIINVNVRQKQQAASQNYMTQTAD